MMHISQLQDRCRKCQEMSPMYGFLHHMIPIFPVLRKCARHTKYPVCRKCHLSCFLIFSFMPESAYRKCTQNFMCPGSGNVPEILPFSQLLYLGNVSVGNVHATNKKCELSAWDFLAQDFFQCIALGTYLGS